MLALLEKYSIASMSIIKDIHKAKRDKNILTYVKTEIQRLGQVQPPIAPAYLITSYLGLHTLTLGHLKHHSS